MTVQPLTEQVRAFLDSYMQAFVSSDGGNIASLYHAPCVTVRADGSVHCLQSSEELRSFFQKLADTYSQEGCRRWRYLDLEVIGIGRRSALVTMTWEMLRADETVIRRWRQSYNLLRVGEAWKILASTFHQG